MKLTPNDVCVLTALFRAYEDDSDAPFLSFGAIAREGAIAQSLVRRTVRRLARKGLTEFRSGLWTPDGEPAGSGYAITPAGRAALKEHDDA